MNKTLAIVAIVVAALAAAMYAASSQAAFATQRAIAQSATSKLGQSTRRSGNTYTSQLERAQARCVINEQ